MVQGKAVQLAIHRIIELAGYVHAIAATQGGGEPQHGGGGYPGNGGAEGQAQAGDGRGQGAADGGQFAAAVQGGGGAFQGHDHAHKGAEQAEHHQQAGEVRGQHRAGQGGGMAVDAALHGMAQRAGQVGEPAGQGVPAGIGLGELLQLLIQPGGVAAIAQQFQKAEPVDGGDQQGNGEGHRIAQKGGANPDNGHGAKGKGQSK